MSLAFCTMTSRVACQLLDEDSKGQLVNAVMEELEINGLHGTIGIYAVQSLRVVVDVNEQVIQIMTENECRRLFPTVAVTAKTAA
ncbi:MAG: hypothetical protein U0796_17685 [Gemmatales bacterium]